MPEAALPLTFPLQRRRPAVLFPVPAQIFRDVILLFAVGAAALTPLFLFGQPSANGLAPYYREVALHSGSSLSLALYALRVSAYAAALESLLRLFQSKVESRWSARTAVIAAALVYSLTHLKFHLPGALYAFLLGLGTATFFRRTRRWFSLVVWHVVWDLAAIAFVIASALISKGAARDAILFEYKLDQVEAGTLAHAEGWGWIDNHHFPIDGIGDLTAHLQSNRGQSTTWEIEEGFATLATSSKTLTARYIIRVPTGSSNAQCHAAAAAVYLHSAARSESLQASQPLLYGTRLSAYAFDDIPSTLAAAYLGQPTLLRGFAPNPNKSQNLVRWQSEGMSHVAQKFLTHAEFAPADPEVARHLEPLLTLIRESAPWFKPSP